MSTSYFVKERKRNKNKLLEMVRNNMNIDILGGGMHRKKLRALFSMKTGLSFKKIDEYLEELLDTELIFIDEDSGTVKMAAKE